MPDTEERKTLTNPVPLHIVGLAELAQALPDDRTYELRILFSKAPDGGASVTIDPTIRPVTP